VAGQLAGGGRVAAPVLDTVLGNVGARQRPVVDEVADAIRCVPNRVVVGVQDLALVVDQEVDPRLVEPRRRALRSPLE
jgi:hypothetical protein